MLTVYLALKTPYAMDSAEDVFEKADSVGDLRLIGRYEFNAESAKLIERLEDISIDPRVIGVGRARLIFMIPSYTKYTVDNKCYSIARKSMQYDDDTKMTNHLV